MKGFNIFAHLIHPEVDAFLGIFALTALSGAGRLLYQKDPIKLRRFVGHMLTTGLLGLVIAIFTIELYKSESSTIIGMALGILAGLSNVEAHTIWKMVIRKLGLNGQNGTV